MMGLVVVSAAGVLTPELDLVELEVRCVAESFGSVDKVRVERNPVEVP
ncbi:MAG: hypothetical protein ACJA14_000988 [Ilumatobacter sp.]|jgi:hypothetical protein